MNIDEIIRNLQTHATTDFSRLYKVHTGSESKYKQKKDGWCGPSALSYAMHLMGIEVPQEQLVRETGTTVKDGVDPKYLVDEARRFGFNTSTSFGEDPYETLKKMNTAALDGKAVLIDYLDGNNLKTDGHYAVFLGLTGNSVIIWNPNLGKEEAIDINDFISRWKDLTIGGKLFKYWSLILSI